MDYPLSIKQLVGALRALPSIGPRSAERLALFLIQEDPHIGREISRTILEALEKIQRCPECGFFTEAGICEICRDEKRNGRLICLVESATDVLAFERSKSFDGKYHVLGGVLSPLDGIGPDELKIPKFLSRVERDSVKEVIIGLNTDVKGETTSIYIADKLKKMDVKVTRLATGLSVGGSLEFANALTLAHALQDRKAI
ncbi:MAG: recombination mediator RecR [Verrucomicrobiota bacterium]